MSTGSRAGRQDVNICTFISATRCVAMTTTWCKRRSEDAQSAGQISRHILAIYFHEYRIVPENVSARRVHINRFVITAGKCCLILRSAASRTAAAADYWKDLLFVRRPQETVINANHVQEVVTCISRKCEARRFLWQYSQENSKSINIVLTANRNTQKLFPMRSHNNRNWIVTDDKSHTKWTTLVNFAVRLNCAL